jgi:hypothetical protein
MNFKQMWNEYEKMKAKAERLNKKSKKFSIIISTRIKKIK